MTLIDTGPLVALLNTNDPAHAKCAAALPTFSGPLLTTWPVLTEAFHLLGRAGGWPAQALLWQMVLDGTLTPDDHPPDPSAVHALMERYRNVPMDVADATLVALAEQQRGLHSLFTLDRHFAVYQLPRLTNRAVIYL
jgi:predicted nucleic acid-binding protein